MKSIAARMNSILRTLLITSIIIDHAHQAGLLGKNQRVYQTRMAIFLIALNRSV